ALLYISSANAELGVLLNERDFSFNHPTCLLRFDQKIEFSQQIQEKLKEKGFKLHDYLPEGKLNPEDMYFQFSLNRKGIIFKDCEVSYQINQASSIRP